MAAYLVTLSEVQEYVGPGHSLTDVDMAWKAAEDYVATRCSWDEANPPAQLQQAVKMQAMRLVARKSSPEGLVGMEDIGLARIPVTDKDVDALMAEYKNVVI